MSAAALLLLSAALLLLSRADDNVLHIGGIFPIGGKGGWQGGQACEPAVRLALDDVNKNSVLSGYQLNLHWNDSEVTARVIRRRARGLGGIFQPTRIRLERFRPTRIGLERFPPTRIGLERSHTF